jgi:predicted nucleic acid-binding protein
MDGLPLVVPGIAYQEILSGVRDDIQLARLGKALEGFPRILAEEPDHLEAARLMNLLRRRGISVSSIDALIAAMTIRREALLFTLDEDFERFPPLTRLKLLPL